MMTLSKEFTDSKVSCPNEKAYYMNNELFDLYDRNGVVFIPATIYAYGTMGFFGESTVFLQPPSIDGSYKPTYNTWLSLAINAKSKHKEEAWKFLKFLISKDMQAQWALNGFTANKEATEIRREDTIERTKKGDSVGFGGRKISPMTDTVLDMADRLTSIPGMMRDNDMQISEIISGEAGSYIAGKTSAEAAAKAMQNKMNIYLNE
jgi:multiple sugar transport system substrate-binding protein